MDPLTDGLTYTQREALEQRIPALRELRIGFIALCDEYAHAMMTGIDVAQVEAKLKAYSEQMILQQHELVRQNGVDIRFLDSEYECPLCRDTGYVLEGSERRPCQCRVKKRQQKLDEIYCAYAGFADFDDVLFADDDQREKAQALKAKLEEYASSFPNNRKPHIHLRGNAGLGKTFFLRCLTRALYEKGVRCAYVPAYALFESFRRQHIGEEEAMQRWSRMPFLALDDLGVEPMYRNITIEYLSELLDFRIMHKLPTAVATNLNRSQLTDRYGERIASRLYDQHQFSVYGLKGTDLRKQLK